MAISLLRILDTGNKPGVYSAYTNGTKMHTIQDFHTMIAQALKFPDYYGCNINALDECINDLDWLDAERYVLLIEEYDSLLIEDSERLPIVLEILHEATEAWQEDAPNDEPVFQVIIQYTPKAQHDLEQAGIPFKVE